MLLATSLCCVVSVSLALLLLVMLSVSVLDLIYLLSRRHVWFVVPFSLPRRFEGLACFMQYFEARFENTESRASIMPAVVPPCSDKKQQCQPNETALKPAAGDLDLSNVWIEALSTSDSFVITSATASRKVEGEMLVISEDCDDNESNNQSSEQKVQIGLSYAVIFFHHNYPSCYRSPSIARSVLIFHERHCFHRASIQ
jgi:hypothetical protein